ncbi:MAG: macro domain-containing protein [Tissierellia bacterium]|nr:macro domain-containing protein [Tissierellia bacterium]
MSLHIITGNLVTMDTDAIVNAANSALIEGGGVCGAIFSNTDRNLLTKACREISPCPTGKAVITKSYGLKANYIIHAVGPIWEGGDQGEKDLLKSAYLESLKLAKENNLSSIAFPLLSGGIYGYPKEKAMNVGISTIKNFLKENDMEVYLVFLDPELTALAKDIETQERS